MGEEVRITDLYLGCGGVGGGGGEGVDDERVLEWEVGLPNVADLTPLSQSLISMELLSAFSITPEPYRSMIDVNRASQNTLSDIQGDSGQKSMTKFDILKSFNDEKGHEMVVEVEETADLSRDGSDFRKSRRIDTGGDGDGDGDIDGGGAAEDNDDSSARASKRPRLVWTPQLHKRFVEVVAHLGVTKAVPKTIMQLMNVEGLTRENVASHLQKYRQYLKRMQGVSSSQPPSSSDHLFASFPIPIHESGGGNAHRHTPGAIPMPYPPQMVPMPYPPHQMHPNSASVGAYQSHSNPYNMAMQQRNWSGNNNFGSVSPYQHRMTPNDK